jgi:hypothetical protein
MRKCRRNFRAGAGVTPDKIALKRAFEAMVRGVGGVEAAAPFCRVGKTKLAEYYSQQMPDRFAPIDVIADLEPLARERTGWPHVTSALCALLGGTFVVLPERPATAEDIFALLAALAKEMADATGVICKAMTDGHMDSDEARAAVAEIDALIAVAAEMRVLLKTIVEGDGA